MTPDYLDKALTMLLSLRRVGEQSRMIVLTTNDAGCMVPGVSILSLQELIQNDRAARDIAEKYTNSTDELRWSLKPVFLRYLATSHPGANILYCDCDCCFFAPPEELFDCLKRSGIVLTPHWRPLNPSKSKKNFRLNFLDGLFNAGCIGANERGIAALTWWAEACTEACGRSYIEGLYYDQRYLDLMPIYFPETAICRHQGYNLADWNVHLRESDNTGTRLVPDKWPVTLVHFTANTIKRIRRGDDRVLEPFLNQYSALLEEASAILQERSNNAPRNSVLDKLEAARQPEPHDREPPRSVC